MKVLLAGCGKMGGAMLQRWLDAKICTEIAVVDPAHSAHPGITWGATPPLGFSPDVVVLAVKPQAMADLLPLYAPYARAGSLFISIAAGRTVGFFQKNLGPDVKIVRAMPNLPASIGRGVTVAVSTPQISQIDRARADALLSAVGRLIWVEDEKLLDPVTALSGSGPAYVFLLTEVLAEAGVQAGLPKALAQDLARLTVEGSAALLESAPDTDAATLRESVTSPGGTTRAALDILAQENIQAMFDKALAAASRRAKELSA